jgi:hypothetical protein
VRLGLALLLFVTAIPFAYSGGAIIANLWADYKDSPDSTYIMFGAPLLAVALACVVGGLFMLRRP